jgi:RNA recognition motif-containing protein
MSIYVGNLSFKVTEAQIKDVFSEYGTVKKVSLPVDRENNNRPRGFAFVEMSSETEEDAAIQALDQAEWMGRELRVNKARPKEPRPNGGGSGAFNGGGRREGGYSRPRL